VTGSRDERRQTTVRARVTGALRGRLAHLGTYRTDVVRRGKRLAADLLVLAVLLAVLAAVVVAAGWSVVYAVNAGGTPGVVLGWTAAFAFAVSVPVVAMKLSSTLYGRLESL
jgi:hypothetical protein